MRIELDYEGVAKNRRYYATPASAGRPRKDSKISKSTKPFAVGATRNEAIQSLLEMVGFVPHDHLASK